MYFKVFKPKSCGKRSTDRRRRRFVQRFLKVQSCFTTLLNPGQPIPQRATAVHHITDDMVANAPTFPEVATCFKDYISGCNIAGHNVKYDLRFLYASGLDLPDNVRYYDTLDLAKKILIHNGQKNYDHHIGAYVDADDYDVENYKLNTLCGYYQIYRNIAHNSLSDCLATAKVMERLIDDKLSKAR